MDTSKISFGEMVAGASGLALFVIMWLFDWFGYEGEGFLAGIETAGGASAFQWMSFLDIVLFLCAVVAMAMAVLRATGTEVQLPAPPGLIVAGAGALAVLIVLFRLLFPGDGPVGITEGVDATRKLGVFLGLLAAGGIAFGGWTAMNERASGTAPPA